MIGTKVLITRQVHIKAQSIRLITCKERNIFVIIKFGWFLQHGDCHTTYLSMK